MKKTSMLTIMALLFIGSVFAQPAAEKPAVISETMYLMPKRGMEDKFEAAVKAHIAKFHPDGPYKAGLRKVEYGSKAGWYLWVFGPASYSALDTRPGKEGGHEADWSSTVDPLVETYGETRLWELNQDLSYGLDFLKTTKYVEVWKVDLKKGQYYRFKALAEKLKKAYELLGTTSFVVYNAVFHEAGGPDVGIVWNFNSYDSWAKDPGVKDTYEKLYGANSWQNLLDEWSDITEDFDSEIRSFIR